MVDPLKARRFEQLVMPHLDSAYNLAMWLTRSDADAKDVVQEACLRAYKYFDGFQGDNPSAWLLSIVRNACFTWLKSNRRPEEIVGLDGVEEDVHGAVEPLPGAASGHGRDPEALLADSRQAAELNELVGALPAEFREVIVLREFEDLSYREIAEIAGIPIGTVMSRLARARKLLRASWMQRGGER